MCMGHREGKAATESLDGRFRRGDHVHEFLSRSEKPSRTFNMSGQCGRSLPIRGRCHGYAPPMRMDGAAGVRLSMLPNSLDPSIVRGLSIMRDNAEQMSKHSQRFGKRKGKSGRAKSAERSQL